MVLYPTDCTEIELIILNLKTNCAVGWDGIPTSVIKDSRHVLIPILSHIFNQCMLSGVFPSVFKKGLIHPIHKSGDRQCVDNYRPISVLSVLSKIFEKILNKRLVKYLDSKNILADKQYGFRNQKSSEDAVLALTSSILKNFETKRKSIGIFLDLTKAFDTVSVPLLLDKLECIGVRGVVKDLFSDYLSGRTQAVVINKMLSDDEGINFGVPQGSVLGPTLFLLYINDLCKLELPNCEIFTYADDTALLINGRNWDEAHSLAESAMSSVMNWLSMNLLTLNVSKTKFITFSPTTRNQPLSSFSIRAHICSGLSISVTNTCNCPVIDRTPNIKYLGVWVDGTLSWKHQVECTVARVRKLIYIFMNLRNAADLHCLRMVYFALAQSVLSYCITAWGGTHKTYMLKLERAQRAVLKVMFCKPRLFPTRSIYSLSEVLTVRQLFVLATLLRRHSLVLYDSTFVKSVRRSDKVCKHVAHGTAVASRHFDYLSGPLYNKVNKLLNICPLTLFNCKNKCMIWLKSLSYEETETLINMKQ